MDFGSSVDVARKLQTLFVEAGWREDPAYVADSPTGRLFGLHKDDQLALVDVGWLSSSEVTCPTDQPISACDMKPEQQKFFITVNVAQIQ